MTSLSKFGNRSVVYIHRTAKDFLATPNIRDNFIGKYRGGIYHATIGLLKGNVLYLKHCMRPLPDSKPKIMMLEPPTTILIEKLQGIFKRSMWLARKAELETHNPQIKALDELRRFLSCFLSPSQHLRFIASAATELYSSLRNINLMLDNTERRHNHDYLSIAIICGLNLYLEANLGNRVEILKGKHSKPYLGYALRFSKNSIRGDQKYDLKTISILLDHGGNPNLQYDYEYYASGKSTPWQLILSRFWEFSLASDPLSKHFIADHFRLEAEGTSILGPSIWTQLFMLMLRHGADPQAKKSTRSAANAAFIDL